MGRYSVAGSGPDCKSGAFGFCWFKSSSPHSTVWENRTVHNAIGPEGRGSGLENWLTVKGSGVRIPAMA